MSGLVSFMSTSVRQYELSPGMDMRIDGWVDGCEVT